MCLISNAVNGTKINIRLLNESDFFVHKNREERIRKRSSLALMTKNMFTTVPLIAATTKREQLKYRTISEKSQALK